MLNKSLVVQCTISFYSDLVFTRYILLHCIWLAKIYSSSETENLIILAIKKVSLEIFDLLNPLLYFSLETITLDSYMSHNVVILPENLKSFTLPLHNQFNSIKFFFSVLCLLSSFVVGEFSIGQNKSKINLQTSKFKLLMSVVHSVNYSCTSLGTFN